MARILVCQVVLSGALFLAFAAAWARPTVAAPEVEKGVFARWGAEALTEIEKDLRLPESDLYAEYGTPDGKRGSDYGGPAFVWPAGFQLRTLAAAAKVAPAEYRAALDRFADALDRYWTVRDGVGGYMVLPMKSERLYDDNAWIALGMLDAYEATGDRKYVDQAARTLAFIAGSEKKTPGGGLRQHEDKEGPTSVCTTAPAAVGALRLYQAAGNPQQLEMAERWYAWLTSKEVGIQDPADGLFDDTASFAGEQWKINHGKRAYNSALPLQAAVLLYQIKKDARYLREAQRIGRAALARWAEPSGAFKETAQWGGSDLADALLALYQVDRDPRWYAAVRASLQFLHEQGRDPNGRYGEDWQAVRHDKPLEKFHLLYMAPAARAFWHAAAAKPPSP
jgi:uncharacterized protein YyaL (SSP411 family)